MAGEDLVSRVTSPGLPAEIQVVIDKLFAGRDATLEWVKAANTLENSLGAVTGLKQISTAAQQATDTIDSLKQSQIGLRETTQQANTVLSTYGEVAKDNIVKQRELQNQLNKVNSELSAYQTQMRGANAVIAAYSSGLKVASADLDRAQKQISDLTSKNEQNILTQRALKNEISSLNPIINTALNGYRAQGTAMDDLNAKLGLLRANYRALTEDQRNSQQGIGIQRDILETDAQLKVLDAGVGNYQRNVGSYQLFGGANNKSELQETIALMRELKEAGMESSDEYKILEERAIELTLVNKEVANSIKEVIAAEELQSVSESQLVAHNLVNADSLSSVTAEMKRLYAAGLQQSEEYTLLEERAIELATANRTVTESLKQQTGQTKETAEKTTMLEGTIVKMSLRMVLYGTIFSAVSSIVSQEADKIVKSIDGLSEAGERAIDTLKYLEDLRKRQKEAQSAFESGAFVADPKDEDKYKAMDRQLKVLQSQQETGALQTKDKQKQKELDKEIYSQQVAMNSYVEQSLTKQKKILENTGGFHSVYGKGGGITNVDNNTGQQITQIEAEGRQNAVRAINNSLADNEAQRQILQNRYASKQGALDLKGGAKTRFSVAGTNEMYEAQKALYDAMAKLSEANLKEDQQNQKEIYETTTSTLTARLSAYDNYQLDTISLANVEAAKEVDIEDAKLKKIADKRKVYQEKLNTKLQPGERKNVEEQIKALDTLTNAANDNKLAAQATLNEKFAQIDRQGVEERRKIFKDDLQERMADIDAATAEKLAAIQERTYTATKGVLNGGGSTDEKKRKITGIGNDATQEADNTKILGLRDQEIAQKDALDAGVISEQEYKSKVASIEEQITALKKQELDKQAANDEAAQKRREEGEKAVADAAVSAIQTGIQAAETIQNNYYTKQLQNLSILQTNEQLHTQQQLEAVQATAGYTVEKQQQLEKIRATSAAQENQIAAQQKQIQVEQARFQRQSAIAAAIENTAVAVSQALTTPGPYKFVLAAIVAAAGAAQIAAAESAPVPQYFKGTDYHPGGPAIVGDGGQHELITLRSGQSFISPNKSTLLPDLAKGAKVTPLSDEIMRMANYNAMPHNFVMPVENNNHEMQRLVNKMEETGDRMVRALRGQKAVVINGIDRSWLEYKGKSLN